MGRGLLVRLRRALPDELSEKLDTLIYGYNDDHDLPQAEDVAAYLEENLSPEELEGYYYECEQEGNDVCVTFYEEGSSAGEPLDWGVAYWYCTDDEDLPGDLATTLSDLLFEYNIDHDLPQAEEVSAYLEENLGSEFDGYSYTCEQEGQQRVRHLFYHRILIARRNCRQHNDRLYF